ncbi:hypothetical protein [Roseateles sp.]|uniref:hypothetical protein n=1 Tax=Roseateles sp. TaxID=1971397 RepID=UPI00286C73CE|nr:hypothetical protein [Roseateles sp.]
MKSKNLIRRTAFGAVSVAAMLVAGAVQAALQDRDLNGDAVVDAFYDTDLDITWLRNANVNGTMSWGTAVAWADGFSFAGHDDWRLPTSDSQAKRKPPARLIRPLQPPISADCRSRLGAPVLLCYGVLHQQHTGHRPR